MRKLTVVVVMTAVLAMMLASAGTSGAKPGGTNGKDIGQGQGSARACGALIEQHAHGKSAHARDLDRLAHKLDKHGCPPPPPCVATNSCDTAPPPPPGEGVGCDGVSGECQMIYSPVISLAGTWEKGPSINSAYVSCPTDLPYIWNWDFDKSSSAVTVDANYNPFPVPNDIWWDAWNWAPTTTNTFQIYMACSNVEPDN